MLFEQAAFEYVNDKQFGRKSVRPNTLEGYLSAIRCHLMPKWSGREIESITCEELQTRVDAFEPDAALLNSALRSVVACGKDTDCYHE